LQTRHCNAVPSCDVVDIWLETALCDSPWQDFPRALLIWSHFLLTARRRAGVSMQKLVSPMAITKAARNRLL